MKKAAFLSMDVIEGFFTYDTLLIEPLKKLNWQVDTISWNAQDVSWKDYDVVIVRSTWDYQNSPKEFLKVLEEINSQTRLENDLEIMKWNMNKVYLRDLEVKGINIVPTLWCEKFDESELPTFFENLNTAELIIKPTISANADNTFWLTRSNFNSQLSTLNSQFKSRSFMVQPFMKNIIAEGEFSLFYFGGKYSHAILKTPKQNDFRVQEEHGGKLKLVQPDEVMKRKAEKVLQVIDKELLYARIDFVRTDNNEFALMELELIEPSLYFNMDPEAAERFAKVFSEWMN